MSDLKPCPFCGGDAEIAEIPDDELGNTGGSVIDCMSCGASTHVEFGFKENLISAWNARSTDAAQSDTPSAVAEAYRRGQEDMRKRAAEVAYQWWDDDDSQELRDIIRAIPIKEKDDE